MKQQGEEDKEIRQIKKEVPGKEERRTRSGRRRENPEGTTISSVKEDPFDHRDRVCDLLVLSLSFVFFVFRGIILFNCFEQLSSNAWVQNCIMNS